MPHFITDENIQGYMFYSDSKTPLNKVKNKESVITFYKPFSFWWEPDTLRHISKQHRRPGRNRYTLIRSLLNSLNFLPDVTPCICFANVTVLFKFPRNDNARKFKQRKNLYRKQYIIKFGYIHKHIHAYTHNKHEPKTLTAQKKITDYTWKEEAEQENEVKMEQFLDSYFTLAQI